jgi:eukaryotic-like serine/threonine-protein kinase
VIFGRYQLLELLGTGGMAEVFRAKSYGVEGFEKLLVIKRILPRYSDNEEFVEMFVNEAKIAVSLNHANIVQIYDLGKAGDSYFMAMEYVQGMDLGQIIRWSTAVGKPFPLETAIHIICEVAKGLDYAHRKKDQDFNPLNIIHRDISPQNILISNEGEVKITDFGIAKALNIVDVGEDGPIKGKFAYMAPEQAIAAPHDRRVDIFSTGVVFYELLTGINPLRDRTPAEILKIIQNGEFPNCQVPCCGNLDSIPVDLEPILRRALAPDPDDRYISAAELYEALLTFGYVEGLRAGASSLAEFIDPLVEEQGLNTNITQLPSIAPRGASSSPLRNTDTNITSVRDPSDTDLAQFEDKNTIQLTAAVREVALLAYSWESKGFDSRKLQKIVESYGAVILEKDETRLTFGFGISVASDALHTAARSACEVSQAIRRDHAFRAAGTFGIGMHLASLAVEFNGTVRLNPEYQLAVERCNALSEIRANAILFNMLLLPLLNRWFKSNAFPHEVHTNLFQLLAPEDNTPPLTKLIGRRQDLMLIGELLAGVSEGKGRVLGLLGAAGVGKTRLLHEVKRRLTSAGHNFDWYETTCSPWKKKKNHSTLQMLLRNMIGAADGDSVEVVQQKLICFNQFGLPPHEVSALGKFVLTGQGENAHVLKSAFIRIIRQSAKKSLIIVAIDHLTAVDDESLDIIHALSHNISDVPVLLTVAIRLGYTHGFEGSPIYTQCDVEPLTDSEMEQLVQAIVPGPSERLIRDILNVSANLPLFAEETIHEARALGSLKVNDADSIYIPREFHCPMRIRNLIASELLALPRDRRIILQLAGCLREKIETDVLSLLLNRPAVELPPILQMLARIRILTAVDESTYRFPSRFIQEAVYRSIEKPERLLIHRTVAQRIEQEFPKDLEKYAEPLAVHYLKSGARKAAFDYLIVAARNAAVTLDHETSVKYYLLALELAMKGIGNVSRYDIFEQLASIAPQTSLANAVLKKAILLKSEIAAENDNIDNIDDIDEIENSYALMLDAQEAILWAHVGEYEEAVAQLRDVISRQDEAEAQLSGRYLAVILSEIGIIGEATSILAEIVQGASSTMDPYANAYLTICLALRGNTEAALARIEAHSPSTSVAPIALLYLIAEGHCLFMGQKYELALEAYTTATHFADEQAMKRETALLHYLMATCNLELMDYKTAFDHLREAIGISSELQFQCLKDRTQIGLWFIDAEKFGSDDALNQLLTMEINPADVETRILNNYCLARIFIGRRKFPEAREVLQRAQTLMSTHKNRFYYSRIKAIQSSL